LKRNKRIAKLFGIEGRHVKRINAGMICKEKKNE